MSGYGRLAREKQSNIPTVWTRMSPLPQFKHPLVMSVGSVPERRLRCVRQSPFKKPPSHMVVGWRRWYSRQSPEPAGMVVEYPSTDDCEKVSPVAPGRTACWLRKRGVCSSPVPVPVPAKVSHLDDENNHTNYQQPEHPSQSQCKKQEQASNFLLSVKISTCPQLHCITTCTLFSTQLTLGLLRFPPRHRFHHLCTVAHPLNTLLHPTTDTCTPPHTHRYIHITSTRRLTHLPWLPFVSLSLWFLLVPLLPSNSFSLPFLHSTAPSLCFLSL